MPKKEQPQRVRGDELARLRAGHAEARLRTQQGLATYAGVATRTVARAEDGFASFETVEQLAKVLGVAPWSLWIPLDDRFPIPDAGASGGIVTMNYDLTVQEKLDEVLEILRHMETAR